MKKKIPKILGLTFALVLALSLVFPVAAVAGTNKWSAETIMSFSDSLDPTKTISPNGVAALAGDSEGEALYAIVGGDEKDGMELGATALDSTAEWSTTQVHSGSYSAKLAAGTEGSAYVEFTPVPGTTVSDLATIGDTDYWYWYDYDALSGGPNIELRFTKADYDSDTGYGHVDVNVQAGAVGRPLFLKVWANEDATTNDTMYYYGNDPVDGDAFSWEFVDGPAKTLADAPALIDAETEMGDASAADWELTRVRIEIPGAIARTCYIDDITIDGVIYLRPNGKVYKSINGGQTWGTPATTVPTDAVALAVAPDDPDYVIAADAAGNVFVTINGGTSWSSTDLTSSFDAVTCVDISVPDSLGKRWIAIGGDKAGAGALMVSKIETFTTPVNAISVWTDFTGSTNVLAVKYSPMLDYDETLLAVTIDGTDTHLQAGSIANDRWNNGTDFGSGWPAKVTTTSLAASIALPDTYDGVEPTARVAYIGTNLGVYRMDNTTAKELIATNYRSVAYNSVDNMLLIGSGISNAVKMSANPDTASPSFTTPLRYKYPSGDNVAAVAWVGSTMVCGTNGAESALSVSTDARSWNQLSLIDSDLDNITDVAVSEDGATIYLASLKGNVASIWRYASSWERVFCVDIDAVAAGDVLVRLVPGDPDHILIGEVDGDELRVSKDAGETWRRAKSKVTIVDIAVKDATTVHVLGDTKVSTSTDGGRHFGTGKKTLLSSNNHIVVAPNGDVLVAGVYAGVVTAAYSTNDGATFSRTAESTGITPEAGYPILIAPDKDYATNSAIFVAFDEDDAGNDGSGENYIMRWEIGAGAEEWKSKGPSGDAATVTVLADAYWFTGLGYFGGALYATAVDNSSPTNSTHVLCVNPGATAPTWGTRTRVVEGETVLYPVTAEFTCAPQALKFSSGSNKLWAVDVTTTTTASKLFSYTDTIGVEVVAVAAPTLLAPAAGYVGSVDVVLERINAIRFSWEQVHKDVYYELEIATDEAMKLNVEDYDVGTKHEYITISDGTGGDSSYPFIAGETYYWRVSVRSPVRGPWSEVRSFSIEEAVAAPVEVTVEVPPVEVPPVEVTVEAPVVTVPAPVITVEAPAAPDVTVEVPPAEAPETPGYIWSIIAIGAVLVIAVIILIIRTRRVV